MALVNCVVIWISCLSDRDLHRKRRNGKHNSSTLLCSIKWKCWEFGYFNLSWFRIGKIEVNCSSKPVWQSWVRRERCAIYFNHSFILNCKLNSSSIHSKSVWKWRFSHCKGCSWDISKPSFWICFRYTCIEIHVIRKIRFIKRRRGNSRTDYRGTLCDFIISECWWRHSQIDELSDYEDSYRAIPDCVEQ